MHAHIHTHTGRQTYTRMRASMYAHIHTHTGRQKDRQTDTHTYDTERDLEEIHELIHSTMTRLPSVLL